MKRLISLFLCLSVVFCTVITALGAKEEEETIPIPEMPEDIYLVDEAGVMTTRSARNVARRGNILFARTGAQVVLYIVGEDNDVELGLLAQEILERWQIGSYERDNGFVLVIDFERGRASYAAGEGLADVMTDSVVMQLITNYEIGDGYADGNYVMVASSLYNDVIATLCAHYGIPMLDWDGKTYGFKAKYEVEPESDYTLVTAAAGAGLILLFFVLIVVSSIRHNKKMREIAGYEKEGGYGDEEEEDRLEAEAENMEDTEPEEDYETEEGEYNTDEGEYNTDADVASYNCGGSAKFN